jgi:hypothetical protein
MEYLRGYHLGSNSQSLTVFDLASGSAYLMGLGYSTAYCSEFDSGSR